MKVAGSVCLVFCAGALAAVPPTPGNDQSAIQFASSVAKKFVDAIDRKRPDVAAQYYYMIRHELPSGRMHRSPIVSESKVSVIIEQREKLGKLLARELVKTIVVSGHQNLPESKFVEFHYELAFQKKEKILEMIKIKVEGEQKGKVVLFHSPPI